MSYVHIVSFLGDVHVYPEDRGDDARILHMVAIGANTDSALYRITVERWEEVRDGLVASIDGEIIDHRTSPFATS